MPKEPDGGLGLDAACGAVGRVLSLRHAWSATRGASAAASWLQNVGRSSGNSTTAASYGISALTAAVAALELHVQATRLESLADSFAVHRLSTQSNVSVINALGVFDTFVAAAVSGARVGSLTKQQADTNRLTVSSAYPLWEKSRDINVRVLGAEVAAESFLSFGQMAHAIENRERLHAELHQEACRDLKTVLLRHELHGSGRVRLAHFYQANFSTNAWHLDENHDVLRSSGVLDETDPKRPLVVVASYMSSDLTCVGGRSLDSKCCANECDELMNRLQKDIGTDSAYPFEILAVAKAVSSSTVDAPRVLPEILSQRLHQIASRNSGVVPLNSLMFAQWLHHAFPRECPYPSSLGREMSHRAQRLRSGASQFDDVRGRPSRSDPLPRVGYAVAFKEAVRTVMLFIAMLSMLVGLYRLVRDAGVIDELKTAIS